MKFRILCTLSLLVLAACSDDEETKTGTDTGADTTVADTGTDTTVEDTGTADTTVDTGTDTTGEDTGTATTVDTGTDTGGPTTDLCQNEADQAIVDAGGVTDAAQSCGLGCLGDADPGSCSADCVATETGLSNACAGCYAGVVVCSIENCLAPCAANPDSDACTSCQQTNCLPEYYACTGNEPPAVPVCGNGVIEAGEVCDDGNTDGTDSCAADCTLTFCGDGIANGVEPCDGIDLGTFACTDFGFDGGTLACSSICDIDNAGCTRNPRCGDGVVDAGEACDDSNTDSTDGCTATCTVAACGDGFTQAGEECDDGNAESTDSCTATCTIAICGDNFVQAGEECDDGNIESTDSCTSTCTIAICGDGFTQPGEGCDDANFDDSDECTTACALPSCGDGFVQAGEACDDANTDNTDGCTNTCTAAVCGDGFVQSGEACDDANTVTESCQYGELGCEVCDATCALVAGATAYCGDGVENAGEGCDDGNTELESCQYGETGCQVCDVTCDLVAGATEYCGDGITNPSESCDDGNAVTEECNYATTSCDVCDNSCEIIAGETDFCGDATVDPAEGCDLGADNSDTNALGCNLDCTVPAWPPESPWYTDTACDLPTCDEAATISTDTAGDWTVRYETLTSDCGNLSNFEPRLVVGNVKTGNPHPLDVAGNCDYTTIDSLRFIDGAFKNDTLITCEVRNREAGIVEMSQSTLVFGDGIATGTATSILTNIPTIPGLVEVPGGRCTATFAITMTRILE